METQSRSRIFRNMMKINKERMSQNLEKTDKKLPVHKRKVTEKQKEAR